MKIQHNWDGSAVITAGRAKLHLDKGDACTLARVHLAPKTGTFDGDIDRTLSMDDWFDTQFGSAAHDGFPLPSFCDQGDQIIADITDHGRDLHLTFGVVTGFADDRYGTEIWEATERVSLSDRDRLRLFADLADAPLEKIEAKWRAEYGVEAQR